MITDALTVLFPDIDFNSEPPDAIVVDDGQNEYIAEWNRPESQPTQQELDASYQVWLSGSLDRAKAAASNEVRSQSQDNYEQWQSAYTSYGDWLAVLQESEVNLRSIRRNALDAIEAATTESEVQIILDNLAWPAIPDQATIQADMQSSLDAIQEAKQFLQDNPNARLLLTLSPSQLENTIENRTAAQETLLLKTLSFAIRYLVELIR